MDRKVIIQIKDEFFTPEANDDGGNSEVRIQYNREHGKDAVADGTEEWKDCVEVMIEGVALTIHNSVIDHTLCTQVAELLAEQLLSRIRELRVDIPGMDSKPFAHISGIMNLH